MLGVVWIGLPLVHAVLLRDLPTHGAALLIDVLVGTFATDTAAYATGRMFGTHKIAPSLSPNKTLEGLIGGFLIGTMGFWFAGLYQDWLSGIDALIIGAAVAAIAPVGDLFESMLKRDLGRKDTGTLFGPHGGLLDRLDAVFFTVVVGYYLASSWSTEVARVRRRGRSRAPYPLRRMKKLVILGSTGSIGTQALRSSPPRDELQVVGLAAGSSWERRVGAGAPSTACRRSPSPTPRRPRQARAAPGTGGCSPARRGSAS